MNGLTRRLEDEIRLLCEFWITVWIKFRNIINYEILLGPVLGG
jgi:hypothetical protein